MPHEGLFGYPNRDKTKEDPQVAGNPHSPGMGDTLAIEKEKVRHNGKTSESLFNRRTLPEGEKTWNIGERGLMHS